MDSMVIMLMEKEAETGFLVREIGSYTVNHGELIDGIFLLKNEEKEIVHIKITVDKDVEDWEYSAVYDEYNPEVFQDLILSFDELEDTYNPTWELTFEFSDNQSVMEKRLNTILGIHTSELNRVWEGIVDKKSNYE